MFPKGQHVKTTASFFSGIGGAGIRRSFGADEAAEMVGVWLQEARNTHFMEASGELLLQQNVRLLHDIPIGEGDFGPPTSGGRFNGEDFLLPFTGKGGCPLLPTGKSGCPLLPPSISDKNNR